MHFVVVDDDLVLLVQHGASVGDGHHLARFPDLVAGHADRVAGDDEPGDHVPNY